MQGLKTMPIKKTTIMSCNSAAVNRRAENSDIERRTVIKIAHAPGIECDRCQKEPYVYKTVFFGATRTYEEDEGWQPASSQRRQRARRKSHWQGHEDEESE
jgi:hypothetical protein